MSDTQQRKDPRETYPINSASEDNEATLRPTKKISGDRTPDTETFSTTAATHLGEESATQSEPAVMLRRSIAITLALSNGRQGVQILKEERESGVLLSALLAGRRAGKGRNRHPPRVSRYQKKRCNSGPSSAPCAGKSAWLPTLLKF